MTENGVVTAARDILIGGIPLADPTGALSAAYDAWHRLVKVETDDQTPIIIHKAEFDGLNRRIKKHLDSDAPADPDGLDTYVHYYYSSAWQVLEERWTATVDEAAEAWRHGHSSLFQSS